MKYVMNHCDRVVSSDGEMVTFSGTSTAGRLFSISVKLSDVNRYLNGALIQDAFPYLSASDRELCLSGTDEQTWKSLFGDNDE